MYTLNKNEIEMYVTTIHNAYPEAPVAALEEMRERFTRTQLEDTFLMEARKKMDTLNTAILINNLSRHHLTSEMAFDVIKYFDDKRITSKLHSPWPDEQMEERIRIIATWHTPVDMMVNTKTTEATVRHKSKTASIPTIIYRFLKPSTY